MQPRCSPQARETSRREKLRLAHCAQVVYIGREQNAGGGGVNRVSRGFPASRNFFRRVRASTHHDCSDGRGFKSRRVHLCSDLTRFKGHKASPTALRKSCTTTVYVWHAAVRNRKRGICQITVQVGPTRFRHLRSGVMNSRRQWTPTLIVYQTIKAKRMLAQVIAFVKPSVAQFAPMAMAA